MHREMTKANVEFDAIKFCAFATLPEKKVSGGFCLAYLKVELGRIVATDGHRLHVANMSPTLEPGFYKVERNTKSAVSLLSMQAVEFPNYQSIVDACNLTKRETHYFPTFGPRDECTPYSAVIRAMDKETTLNYGYVEQALQYANEVFSMGDSLSPVYLADSLGLYEAFIMPRKM